MKDTLLVPAQKLSHYVLRAEGRHTAQVYLVVLLYAAVISWVAQKGFDYYRLAPPERAFHPMHPLLRPSGTIGIRLAMLGVFSFCWIYVYALRKRWRWLGKKGKTRNWLDVHVVMGVGAPVLITFHSAFKMGGLAGIAYWIMIAVMASGIVGRYLYAQIPRQINAAELSLQEMQSLTGELTRQLQNQTLVSPQEMEPLLAVPEREDIEKLPLLRAVLRMAVCDVQRPFLVARLRRRSLSLPGVIATAGGLLPSGERSLEEVIRLARRRSWMAAKISFLSKTHQVFHLWHVVHRPFSYSFAILACVHIVVVVLMGYF